jgi:hypothetical protein
VKYIVSVYADFIGSAVDCELDNRGIDDILTFENESVNGIYNIGSGRV